MNFINLISRREENLFMFLETGNPDYATTVDELSDQIMKTVFGTVTASYPFPEPVKLYGVEFNFNDFIF